ncbi:SpoIIE family protein phosphatase [Treponema brennaborense]|uniref:Protein serine/threonine phosphatase with extracellular sensor n=1 Tax=Treponema brennaborense (strain DSM 12168 / CIP 105900 / DD5/3) TaxID=906968 RepID=F4LQF1_TREBD|nr:SpoIIE family protein phosphatase [Treponema brennaborense]AEE17160.1 protein serine/threonine phosphatase with extracellular sensor [Treponema brennaborense DSM 12168]
MNARTGRPYIFRFLCVLQLCLSAASFAAATDFYWENPLPITESDTRFPQTVSSPAICAVFYQEIVAEDSQRGSIYLSAQTTRDGSSWNTVSRFAGPFAYAGEIPDIYSAAVSRTGTIAVAASADSDAIRVYLSRDYGATFVQTAVPRYPYPLVAPRLYALSDGGFILFASLGENESFSLLYAYSADGENWSEFSRFPPAAELTNAFVPMIASVPAGDIAVFQVSYNSGSRLSYQLYSALSADGGRTWGAPVLITGDASIPAAARSSAFTSYHNQRPYVFAYEGDVYLAWERTYYASEESHIFVCRLDSAGTCVAGSAEELTTGGTANRPILFDYGGALSLLWFDSRRGTETVYLAQKNGFLWEESALSPSGTAASFANFVIPADGQSIHVFWQQSGGKSERPVIVRLSPDRTVAPAKFIARSFSEGQRSASEKVSARVVLPADSSGIAGYSWIWTQSPYEQPPRQFMRLSDQLELAATADVDGDWFFKARVLDYAGNWSEPSSLRYVRDTTPPEPPVVTPLAADENGFALSNTFTMNWQPAAEDYIAGYAWSLEYLAPLSASAETLPAPSKPPLQLMGKDPRTSYSNRSNGWYAFSVAAIDTAGNVGLPSSTVFALNKYIPYTTITAANSKTDEFGTITLTILGRGYTYDGTVSDIYIDRDGSAPYDAVLSAAAGDFTVYSDSRIGGITLPDLDAGTYRIGLMHTDRGLYFSAPLVTVTQTGTVKFGNYTYDFIPPWQPAGPAARYSVQIGSILIWAVFALALIGFFAAVRGIVRSAQDAFVIRREIQALLTGDSMPLEKKHAAARLKQKGISLKVKLVFFTIFLVLMIILLISVPLGVMMIRNQEQTLAAGLEERASVLLESLSSGVRAYLPQSNILELSFLPSQSQAMAEARYATITGFPANAANTNLDYVWATNDPEILSKLDTQSLSFGSSRLTGDVITEISLLCSRLNEQAQREVGEMAAGIAELNAEGISLAAKTDRTSVERRQEISTITTQLGERLTQTLNDFSKKGSGSWPQYDSARIDRANTEYVFYKPVLYRQGTDQNYVRGIVLLSISTESLVESVRNAQNSIMYTVILISLIAIAIGAVGSLILASVIIRPIRRLVAHVSMIRDTDDKESLNGKDIVIKSKDEIGLLGETVNDMTHGLVKAAAAAKDLTVGKEVQKMFIPLETDSAGKKLTTGAMEDAGAQFFGYYEGAKGVSGDYFDYKKLDDRRYAIIKCDVSGKGVPAALIMVEVATLFLNYFEDWTFKTHGTNLTPIVSQINDLIESRGFKGRFAAFTLCLFDSVSGDVHFCNAGDNLIHIYDGTERLKKTVTLPESAAAGVFPTFMVDMKGGFRVSSMKLKSGDVLFLYTDGIEEAKRLFRTPDFKPCVCAEAGLEPNEPHENHLVGQDGEELSPERVNAIIEAVFSRSTFNLVKYHNPVPGEILQFDFTTCEGTAEDAIMALVSIEKVFRMYKTPNVTEFDRVPVDRKIDAFLNEHFVQYGQYCLNKADFPGAPEYLYYTYMKEDEQYDDLTLVAVKKK